MPFLTTTLGPTCPNLGQTCHFETKPGNCWVILKDRGEKAKAPKPTLRGSQINEASLIPAG
jgi:hypothetical protein